MFHQEVILITFNIVPNFSLVPSQIDFYCSVTQRIGQEPKAVRPAEDILPITTFDEETTQGQAKKELLSIKGQDMQRQTLDFNRQTPAGFDMLFL